jgi:7,8-dihydropterin-6-yl-methyl-4-(beta-D-ribofuranosyl)aminobenzene 5'-phosphate synthase
MMTDEIRDLKVTTLAENSVVPPYLGQWGLSLLLELVDADGKRRKIVFDTGIHRESLFHNVKEMKVDLGDVDCLAISHGHHDHTAATAEVVKLAQGPKVYAHPHTFLPRFVEDRTGKRRRHGVPEGEGLEEIEQAGGEVVLSKEPAEILPSVWTTGQIPRVTAFERALPPDKGRRDLIVVDGEEVDDHNLDDQALWMNVHGFGPLVITGCAHAGPVNTILHAQELGGFKEVRGLIGGTHLVGRSDGYVQQTIRELGKVGLKMISPCHCTGFKAMAKLWQAFPRQFVLNFSGRTIEVGKEPRSRLI